MPTLGNTPRPAYVYDTETDTWVPVGVGAHTHSDIPNTLVDAKGDLITATADNVPARLAKGADGTVLVSDSTTSTGLAWQPYAAQTTGKNAIINGAFDFWQRGTTFTSGSAMYTADRWPISPNGGTMTISRINSDLTGFRYAMRVQRPQGGTTTAQIYLGQGLVTEDVIHMQGKQVTISFYARAGANYSSAGSILSLGANWGTGTGGYVYAPLTNDALLFNTGFTLTTSWQRFSYTFTMPATMTEFRFYPYYTQSGTAGANDYYDMTGWQLELGPVATTFSRYGGNIQGELAACQRYYYRAIPGISTYGLFEHFGVATSTTTIYSSLKLPVTMRTNPSSVDFSTLRTFGQTTGVYNSISNVTINTGGDGSTSPQLAMLLLTSTGLTTNAIYGFGANNSTSAYIGVSAEL
jgi:hypothetical protein